MKKTGWWRDFLTDESTKAAIALGVSRVKGLVKHMLPTEISGHITFDHEDPSVTGGILAVLGATIPIHKNRIIVTPEFQCENALEGEVFLKGRIMLIVFALAAARLLLCRDVRNVIRNWKHKEV
ncbi:MAG: hypothetical protein IIY55_06785 [Blautia sp.]|nr:hypothetical protein [Blautia sp.]